MGHGDQGEASSSPSDWMHFYQRNIPCQTTAGGGIVFGRASPMTESTVVTTTTVSAPSQSAAAGAGGDRVQAVSEGRVGKAGRRRSRASRRVPTTVLNTDTANFRAMVQQFTGGPSMHFHGGYPHVEDCGAGGGPVPLIFGLSGEAAAAAAAAAAHLHHQQPAVFSFGAQQQQHPQLAPNPVERPLFLLGGNGDGDGGGDGYLPGFLSNPQRGGSMGGAAERLLLDGNTSTRTTSRPAASADNTTTTTTSRFFS